MKPLILLLIPLIIIFSNCNKESVATNAGFTTGAGGSLARFAIAGNYMYTVDEKKLTTYDITNPANPVLKKVTDVGFQIETIFPFHDKLFIGSTTVIHIFSIADPSNPQKLSTAISPDVMRRCDPVVAKDTVAFATLRTNGPCGGMNSILAVFDIKDITKPIQKASFLLSEPYGLGYAGNALYVCDKQRGLMIMNITNPYNPILISSLKDGSYIDVIPYQNILVCWVTTGIIVYDITNVFQPVRLSTIN